jgi:hypothetical protein
MKFGTWHPGCPFLILQRGLMEAKYKTKKVCPTAVLWAVSNRWIVEGISFVPAFALTLATTEEN